MSNKKSIFSGILIGTFVGIIATASIEVFALKPNSQTLPLLQLKKFSEVYARIKNDYVEVVDDKQLITDAISGMLKGLDPHSDYLDEDSFKELREGTSGEFGGLGIEVGQENGYVKVIAPIDDTPAKKAGIKSGDLIIRLGDKSIKDMSLNDAVKLMRGKPGEAIDLVITREGASAPIKIKIVRAVIKVKSVKKRMLEKDYGYLRISNFQSKTTESTRTAIEDLIKENKQEIKGLILDLRDNPGGVLTGAVGVSDVFLSSGRIVYTEGRVDDAVMEYDALSDDLLEGAPLVVLVNQGSASASEIVAGALQDHKRALILGTKTFGKGSVQTVLPLDESTGLKLTTARYFTPSGRSIQAKGIEPDIEVKALEFKNSNSDNDEINPLSESDLSGHLSNPNSSDLGSNNSEDTVKEILSEDDANDEVAKSTEKKKSLVEEDFQLYEALNILKSMNLVRSMNIIKG